MIKHYVRHLDYLMLATVLSISAFGLWIMKNATRNDPGNMYGHQLVYVAIGVVGMLVVAAIPPSWMRRRTGRSTCSSSRAWPSCSPPGTP